MPASKTKQVRTPAFRESILSALIRDTVGDGMYGPDWANKAPQGKVTKMRNYPQRSNKEKKAGREGTVFDTSRRKGY